MEDASRSQALRADLGDPCLNHVKERLLVGLIQQDDPASAHLCELFFE